MRIKQARKYPVILFFAALLYLGVFAVQLFYREIPDELYVVEGTEPAVSLDVPVVLERKEESVEAFSQKTEKVLPEEETYTLSCKLFGTIPVKEVSVHVTEKQEVMPSGMPIGIYTRTDGVLVLGTGKIEAMDGFCYEPAYQKVHRGDYIKEINGISVADKNTLMQAVADAGEGTVVLKLIRNKEPIELRLKTVQAADGTNKLGIWVRDDMAGIGTLAYVREDGSFGALGHPVSDADTGTVLTLSNGDVYETEIVGIVKGRDGTPGELTGMINYSGKYRLGNIAENTCTGIYGTLERVPEQFSQGQMEAAMKQEIHRGEAFILSSLNGSSCQYTIQIDEVDYHSEEANKGILFHVTDERLLEQTGGIVQGMSGSPIIQDGKLIGAVTHVFVNNPAKGYGIFMENMLEH